MKALFHWKPLLATIIWGGSYSAIKAGIHEIHPITFAGFGVFLAASILFIFALFKGKLKPTKINLKDLLIANLAQFCFQISFIFGLSQTSASNSAILLATAPIITLVAACFLRKQLPEKNKLIALIVGFAGVALVVGVTSKRHILGNFLALGSAAAWSWYSLALKPLTEKHGSLVATPLAMLLSLVCFTPYALCHFPLAVSLSSWGGLAYNAVGGLVFAMLLWNQAMNELETNKVMVYTYFEPLVALVISAFLFHEQLLLTQLIGCLFVLTSIYLTEKIQ